MTALQVGKVCIVKPRLRHRGLAFELSTPAGRRTIYFVHKYEWPMEFWYSTSGLHQRSEPPEAAPDSILYHFDVRDLSEAARDGLDIVAKGTLSYAAPEAERLAEARQCAKRQREAHVEAIMRAIDRGEPLTPAERGENLEQFLARMQAVERERREQQADAYRRQCEEEAVRTGETAEQVKARHEKEIPF